MTALLARHPLPAVLVIIDLGCVAWYAWHGDYPRAFYWFFAAGITGSTIFIK